MRIKEKDRMSPIFEEMFSCSRPNSKLKRRVIDEMRVSYVRIRRERTWVQASKLSAQSPA
jgi:hypothetical protein